MPEHTGSKRNLKALLQTARGAKRAHVLIYGNVDPDALASAWALKTILSTVGVKAAIGYTGQVGRLENEAMISLLKIPAYPVDRSALAKADLVALVDCQPDFFREHELPRWDIVIDHHPRQTSWKAAFVDVRPDCLSTCSIMTDYWIALGKPIPKKVATALYHGYTTDSQGLRRVPSILDRRAIAFLEKTADKDLHQKIEFAQYSLGGLDYFGIALAKRRAAAHSLYAHLGPVPYTDVCAQIADFLIRVKEVHLALVSGVVDQTLVVVFRCDGRKKNAGALAQAGFGKIGSAGGHRPMGRAEIDESSLPPGVSLTQNESVERFVVGTLAKVDPSLKPLFKILPSESVQQQRPTHD